MSYMDLDYKIGVIYVSSSLIMEWEWKRILPDDVSFHTARLFLDDGTSNEKSLYEMISGDSIEIEAKKLKTAEVDVITFACTTGTFMGGKGWDKKIARRIEEVSDGIAVSTTSTGLLNSLDHLGSKKITLVTPYIDEINMLEKKFLEDNGYEVVAMEGVGCLRDQDIGRVTPDQFVELAEKIDLPESDTIFISCTNSRSIEAIEILENKLNKPVLSSNQVTLWDALRVNNRLDIVIEGYGSLFDKK